MWALVLMLLIAPCLVGIAGPWINKAFNYNGITLVWNRANRANRANRKMI